jgi:hypothetical protein
MNDFNFRPIRKSGLASQRVSELEPPAIVMDGLDGFLRETVDYIVRTARSPQPLLSLGSAICAVSAASGRRYRDVEKLRTNVMVMGLAGSGSGKERPRSFLSELFREANLPQYLGGSKIASSAGLTRALSDHPVKLFPMDEAGQVYSVNGSRNAGTHKMEIGPLFTELFSKSNSTYDGVNYGDSKAFPVQVIHNPHLVIYGVTVPGPLWKALGSGAMSDGSLARFLFLQTPDDDPDPNKRMVLDSIPDTIIERLCMMAGAPGGVGNLARTPSEPMTAAQVVADIKTVLRDGAAAVLIDQVDDEETALKRQHRQDDKVAAFWARYGEHVKKLSMIKAISRDPLAPVTDAADVRWATALAKHCIEHVITKTQDHVADSATHAFSNEIKCMVRDKGPMTKSQITRLTQKMDTRTRDSVLADLVAAEILDVVSVDGKTKATKSYSFVGDASNSS